ncbi:MAG: radical SAM/SPASM domain-containing protein [bacterium]
MISELKRFYNSAKIFRFFIYHLYIYKSIFRDLLEKYFFKPPFIKPRNIVLKLSTRCNAHCKFCYAQNENKLGNPELTLEEWKEVIDQSRELGCYTVTLSGGEPMIYPHLVELVRYVRKKRMIPFTTTNGLAASRELLKELDSAGLCALNFSIHGPREYHDALVGVPGAFDRNIENGEFCARHTRIVAVVNHVLTNESVRNGWYEELRKMAKAKGFRAFNILPVCVSSPDKSDLLGPQELDVLDRLAKDPEVLMDTKNYSTPHCPAAREDLLVNNYGDVQPCPFIPISFGNVHTSSIKDLFLRIQNHPMFEKQRTVCMPARDHQFIDDYITPAFKNDRLPAPIEDIWSE